MAQRTQQLNNPLRTLQNFLSPKKSSVAPKLSLHGQLESLNKQKIHSELDLEKFYNNLILVIDSISNEFFFVNREDKIKFYDSILEFMNTTNSSSTQIDFEPILNDPKISDLFRINLGYFKEKNQPEIRESFPKSLFKNTIVNWNTKLTDHVQTLLANFQKSLDLKIPWKNKQHNSTSCPLYLLPSDLLYSIVSHLDMKTRINFGKSSYFFSRIVDSYLIKLTQFSTSKLNFKQILGVEPELRGFFTNINFFNEFAFSDEKSCVDLGQKIEKYKKMFDVFQQKYDFLDDITKLEAWEFATHLFERVMYPGTGAPNEAFVLNDCFPLFIPFILHKEFNFTPDHAVFFSEGGVPTPNKKSFLKKEHMENFLLSLKPAIEKYQFKTMRPRSLPFYKEKEGETIYPFWPVFTNPGAIVAYEKFLKNTIEVLGTNAN